MNYRACALRLAAALRDEGDADAAESSARLTELAPRIDCELGLRYAICYALCWPARGQGIESMIRSMQEWPE